MAYQVWSVVFGEQPSASKWNILGTNDAGFNDGTAIGDDAIIARHIANNAVSNAQMATDTWLWEKLADVTLGANADSISSGTFTTKKHLRLIAQYSSTGGNADANIRFNNDSGSNYAVVFAGLGAVPTTSTSQSSLIVTGATTINNQYIDAVINNTFTSKEKYIHYNRYETSTAGAGNAPNVSQFFGKWANTSVQITRIDLLNLTGPGDFASGSRLIVLGHD